MIQLGVGRILVETGRGQNDRGIWQERNRLAGVERKKAFIAAMVAVSPRSWKPSFLGDHRLVIHVVRCSPTTKPLDEHDNLRGALKHCVDGLADRFKVDDGDRRLVRWTYDQKIRTPWAVEFVVGLEARAE